MGDLVFTAGDNLCSTPGGVFVGFTRALGSGVADPISAQRPGASLSGSPHVEGPRPGAADFCSTPGGVFVGFTRRRPLARRAGRPAQRPGASLSGSRTACRRERSDRSLLNARGRLCRVHFEVEVEVGCEGSLLNARGRLCRVHLATSSGLTQSNLCSTPGGVFVGFTATLHNFKGLTSCCSTPGGVFVGFTLVPGVVPIAPTAAQRPGASLSGSPRRRVSFEPKDQLLNARGRLCRVHATIRSTG